jgi:hypothetical protein
MDFQQPISLAARKQAIEGALLALQLRIARVCSRDSSTPR